MRSARNRQSADSERHIKLSVTVPPAIVDLAQAKVAAGEAPSLSAVVTRALERDLVSTEDELDQLIRHWIDAGELSITSEHREWANQVLDL